MMDREYIYEQALAISKMRPTADHDLEQFLMNPQSMTATVERLATWVGQYSDGVVMIGDDDHISILLALATGCAVTVYEYDERIVESLNSFAKEKSLLVNARRYDVREPFPDPGIYRFFYINPPFSSKTNALGIKVWLTRALEACVDKAEGVLVMPRAGERDWTRRNYLEVQSFLSANGCVIDDLGNSNHAYEDTNDPALMSSDLHITRVDATASAPVSDISASTRIYR